MHARPAQALARSASRRRGRRPDGVLLSVSHRVRRLHDVVPQRHRVAGVALRLLGYSYAQLGSEISRCTTGKPGGRPVPVPVPEPEPVRK